MPGPYGGLNVKGYARYTNLNAVRRLTDTPAAGTALPEGAVRALIQPRTQAVNWVPNTGTGFEDPAAAVGFVLAVGQVLEYEGNLATIAFFEAAASAVLMVAYYGP